jgi:hypothetical protein
VVQALALDFARELSKVVNAERRLLDDWLKEPSEETRGKPQDERSTFFDRAEVESNPRPPALRLRAFIASQAARPKLPSEAKTVVRFRERGTARRKEQREVRAPEQVRLGR